MKADRADAIILTTFYVANWNVAHGPINGDSEYLLLFLAVAAFGDRILGLDVIIKGYGIDGTPLVEKYLTLDYVLG